MTNDVLSRIKIFWNAPTPVEQSTISLSLCLKIVFLFIAFYSVFKFSEPPERFHREIIEFFCIVFSLFSSLLLLNVISQQYTKLTQKRLIPTFGYSPIMFILIYSMMVVMIYGLRFMIYGYRADWVWRYYWRHLPFALMVFSVYLYREYKNSIIDHLIAELNTKLANANLKEKREIESGREKSHLLLKVDDRNVKLLPGNITHITVDGHYLDIHYQKEEISEVISIRRPLNELLEDLPDSLFLRIHRSHIINLDFLSNLKKESRRYFVNLCGRQFSLPISRSNLPHVMARLEARG